MGQIPEIHNGLSPTIKHNIISSNTRKRYFQSIVIFWVHIAKKIPSSFSFLFFQFFILSMHDLNYLILHCIYFSDFFEHCVKLKRHIMLIYRFWFLTELSDLHLILILMLQKLEFLSELVVQTDVVVIFFWILVILHCTLQ